MKTTLSPKRLVVAISGASGMIYAAYLLKHIPQDYQIHLIVSREAGKILQYELNWNFPDETFPEFAQKYFGETQPLAEIIPHSAENHFAPVASGSFRTNAMVVIPCSMKTLSGIANGYAHTLIERTADVHLKERRKLVLVVRETPYNQIHLQNMLQATQAGAIVLPASPGFYHRPQTVEDLVRFVVGKTITALGISHDLFPGWREEAK